MTIDDLIYYAGNKVLRILSDCGLKYLHSDISPKNVWDRRCAIHTMIIKDYVTFTVQYDEYKKPQRGKRLKKERDKFYDFYNVSVEYNGIVFKYTQKELEIEYLKNDNAETQEEKTEHIMKKIEKLLALQDSPNEHEALSASLMAQKLLAKYNIDINEIRGPVEEKIEEASVYVDSGNKWKYSLASVIADNYRCKVYYRGSVKVVFRGYRTDVMVARRVYAYLFSVGKRLGKAYEKKYREKYGYAEGIYNSYCLGFINGIKLELEKQCTALQLYCPAKVEEDWEKFSSQMKNINTELNLNNAQAYKQGEYDGKNSVNATYLDDSQKYIKD